jgi:CRP-like cAMP-binding protein
MMQPAKITDTYTPKAVVPARPFRNALLIAMDIDMIRRLHLHPVNFELEHEIEFPGTLIDHLYFIEEGMASMTTTFENGSQVEVGMFGYESVIGVSALMGTKPSSTLEASSRHLPCAMFRLS